MGLVHKFQNLFRHQRWQVGIVDHPIQSFLDPDFKPAVNWMPPQQASQFRADPFLMPVNDRVIVFYEDFDYTSHVGRISIAELIDGGLEPIHADVLGIDCHLAYPFTLQHEGKWYCIPETQKEREVSLWELDLESWRLSKVATLIADNPAVDSTVFQHEGRWWLACTLQDQDPLSALHLWYADDLFGVWHKHPGNPVKLDISSARPAGTPFRHNGNLYRPAQDCSERYGGAVAINRIVELTPDEFSEETVRRVEPFRNSPYPSGIHTLSSLGDRTVVDGLRYTFLPSEMVLVLKRGLSKLVCGLT